MRFQYTPYAALFLGILSLWMPGKKTNLWKFFLLLALLIGFLNHAALGTGILAILLFYFFSTGYASSSQKNSFWWVLVFFLGFAFEINKVPGFHPLWVIQRIQFTPDAIPFSLALNLGKIAAGLILLGVLLPLAAKRSEWRQCLKQTFFRLPLVLGALSLFSIMLGYVRWEPKFPSQLPLWMISNLFFCCVAEEGFFRGFLQESLSRTNYRYSPILAIVAASFAFGLAHYQGGIYYILLAAIAGIFYGWVYHVTKRIEASIITHFLLNLTHLLLFTYPALSR